MKSNWVNKVAVCVSLISVVTGAATITIDPSIQSQTIEGFGVFAQCNQFGNTAYTSFLHDNLGVTMVRVQIPGNFEPVNDNGDPNVTDMTKFNASSATQWLSAINGLKRYPDVRFIATIWTPPAWMKDLSRDLSPTCSDGPGMCGGHLKQTMNEELAENLLGFYKFVEQQTGVKLYGISIQNETAFIEPYVSCVYTPAEYAATFKVVASRFEKEGVNIKFYGAEDMAGNLYITDFFGSIKADTAALRMFDVVAMHGYSDGIHPAPSGQGAMVWSRVQRVAGTVLGGKTVWMTETSGFSADMNGGLNLSSSIYSTLKYGKGSAWVHWSDNVTSNEGLLSNSAHTKRSLAAKNYYKYIRPGAIMIDVKTPDSVLSVAFNDKTNSKLVIVVHNDKTGYQLTLGGTGIPAQMRKYTTSASKDCIDEGMVNSSGIAIDASSVTTLVGEGYNPPAVGVIGAKGSLTRTASKAIRTFAVSAQGRVIQASATHGMRLEAQADAQGRTTGLRKAISIK